MLLLKHIAFNKTKTEETAVKNNVDSTADASLHCSCGIITPKHSPTVLSSPFTVLPNTFTIFTFTINSIAPATATGSK